MEHTRTPESSQIYSHGYDPATQTAEIKFLCRACKSDTPTCDKCQGQGWSGHYAYDGVPPEAYQAMLTHSIDGRKSVGGGFSRHIRAKGFAYRRLA